MNCSATIQTAAGNIEIVSGGARGADRLGEAFAQERNYKLKIFRADWERLGKIAGFVRNEQMAVYASEASHTGVLIAFWDGKSEGTSNMITLAFRYGLKVYVVNY
ncbi:MAG: Phi18:3 [Firmicutes bacterium]|nr:Phi18:3 [Bacillota bacterium]